MGPIAAANVDQRRDDSARRGTDRDAGDGGGGDDDCGDEDGGDGVPEGESD